MKTMRKYFLNLNDQECITQQNGEKMLIFRQILTDKHSAPPLEAAFKNGLSTWAFSYTVTSKLHLLIFVVL